MEEMILNELIEFRNKTIHDVNEGHAKRIILGKKQQTELLNQQDPYRFFNREKLAYMGIPIEWVENEDYIEIK